MNNKDLDDIVNVLSVSGSILNWEYLTAWARKHGTLELLEQLRAAVPELPDSEIC